MAKAVSDSGDSARAAPVRSTASSVAGASPRKARFADAGVGRGSSLSVGGQRFARQKTPKARPLPSATWQDHGVRHVAHVVRNSGEAAQPDDFTRGAPADGGPSAEGVDDEAWRIFWSQALEDNQAHMAAALALLAKHLARVPKGSVVLEVGSRCGDVTVDMARRFPALQVQPTESTGRAATGLFLMLQERVLEYNTELSKDAHRDVPKILAPTRLDTAAASRWSVEFGRQGVGSVFAINVCQFMSAEALAALIHGCKSILSRNGFVFLCGPMLPIGEAVPRDSDLLYNEALRKFMEEVQIREAENDVKLRQQQEHQQPQTWGAPSLRRLRADAEAAGFDIAYVKAVEQSWTAVLLRPRWSQAASR